MIRQIEAIRKGRSFLLERLKDLSNEQFNQIPEGFKNNIIWNLGHMVAVQQGICYKRAGLGFPLGNDFWESYGSGTKPEGIVAAEGVEFIRQLLLGTLDQTAADYNRSIFTNYTAWTARNGMEIANIDTAINFS